MMVVLRYWVFVGGGKGGLGRPGDLANFSNFFLFFLFQPYRLFMGAYCFGMIPTLRCGMTYRLGVRMLAFFLGVLFM